MKNKFIGLATVAAFFVGTAILSGAARADDLKTGDAIKSDSKTVAHDTRDQSQKAGRKAKKTGKKAAKSTGQGMQDLGNKVSNVGK